MRFSTLIWHNLLRRRLRSALTSVGVGVAIMAVAALLAISRGFEESMAGAYESRGIDLVVVRAGVAERLTSSLDQRLADRLRKLPFVEDVVLELRDQASLGDSALVGTPLLGWEVNSQLYESLTFTSGRPLKKSDRHAVLLGEALAERLGKQVGDTVELLLQEFRVVGIFTSRNRFENLTAVVQLQELQELMDRPGQVTSFQLKVRDSAHKSLDVEAVRAAIESLTDRQGRKLGLLAQPTRRFVTSTLQIRIAHAMAWVTSAIALVIGAIGILNTMIMSVLERTREIGVLRAIGWRKSRVVRMILSESLALSVAGAVVGVVSAATLVKVLSSTHRAGAFLTQEIPAAVVGRAMLMSIVLGLVGGLYPALRAAALRPTEALRHD
ncbi:MAG: ABC transporter permease [Pirellulales bacterium]|nr:ABC transporter permease [Pirellulales bacterium]